MRVAELVAPGGIELACHTISDPGPGQVQVKVGAVGICGSDVLSFSCGGIGGMECQYPQVLGHEATGVVVRTGEGVNGWAVGNRVALEPALYCYHCELCMSGRHNICERVRFHSSAGVPGFLRECVSLPAENLLPLPPEIDLNYGTLFEPLAVVLHAMKFAQLQPLETAAVFGAGPIGLLTIALLKMSGAGRTYAIEPVAFRRELAIQAGADAAIDPREVAAAVQVARETAGRGVDLTMDCAARKTSLDECVETTRNGGRLVVLGIPHELELPFNWHVARRKELIIYNVRRSNRESETALQLLKEQPRRFRFLLTHALPLERTQSAFEMLRDQSEGAGKVVIVFQ
ncbi:MAG: alcohol dehydrogenase catalytic domain-containing protein [Acidobacteriia bacterium]|nr:alcohol dehydrogenase catalytic domain-containing protein [Terriglobia bacterium]